VSKLQALRGCAFGRRRSK